MNAADPDTLSILRRLLLALTLVAMAGMILDLALLKHFESGFQILPLAILGVGLLATLWLVFGSGAGRVHLFRAVMAFTIAVGVTGMLLHYRGSMEFQTETYPDLAGWKLFLKVVTSKSPPALAPGAMVQLGLLGLLATLRHPSLPPPDPKS
jgi:hypothetical protein